MEGTVLHFENLTTSPFHTSRKEYANLIKCAPFILGSTFRGAILDYLIRTFCSHEQLDRLQQMKDPKMISDFHRQCPESCLVKLCFDKKPLIWFSFGEFEAPDYVGVTRIGLARDTRSAAEGSIFNIETIAPGSSFIFRVILFDLARDLTELITEAVKHVGNMRGLGRGRSIGFGRFDVLNHRAIDFESLVTDSIGELPSSTERLEIKFTTPFVLGEPIAPAPLGTDSLGQYISAEICKVASVIRENEIPPMAIRRCDARINPEFVGRFSYERGLRENRLVAWQGSSVVLDMEGDQDTDQLAVASVLGIGLWNNCGFGHFSLI